MNASHLLQLAGVIAGVGIVWYIIVETREGTGSYKDKNMGKNNIVRPGGSMPPGKKVYPVWNGAYSSVYPLTRSL